MKKKLLLWIIITTMIFSPVFAFADDTGSSQDEPSEELRDDRAVIAEVTFENGSVSTFSDAANLVNTLSAYQRETFTIKLMSNISTKDAGMFAIPSNSKVTLDLNGYVLNRHEANRAHDTDENLEVIIVNSNAELTIIDSEPYRTHGGYIAGDDGYEIWFQDENKTDVEIEGGIIAGGASDNGGGGITIKNGATVTMKGGTIAGNYSYDGGGGVQLRNDGAKFILDGGKILYNGAWREKGGGIKAQEGMVEIISGEISNNWAKDGLTVDGDGGGIYINEEEDRALYIHGSCSTVWDGTGWREARSVKIENNYADDEGGGIYLDEGTSTILNAEINNNTCTDGDGGGININDDGNAGQPTAVTGCIILGNTAASGDGGGISISNEGNIQIGNCVIEGNYASDEGGGIYFNAYGDNCSMTDCTITGNTAKRNGGGVYLEDYVTIGGVMVVKDNTANDGKHDLFFYNEKMILGALSNKSEMYVANDWGNGSVVTMKPTAGSAKGIFGDGDYHFEKINDPTDSDYRYVVQKKGKAEPQKAEVVSPWDAVNRDQTADATNLGYTMKIDDSKDPVNGAPVYRGYLRFADAMNTVEGEYHTMNYYYSDGVFFNDPEKYDKHLASMTASLTMASGAASKGISTVLDPATQKNRFNYLTQVFSDIGCTNESMYVNDCYQRKPEKDTMGVAMANKTIYKDNVVSEDNAYLLIPVFVRSYNYGPEWMSNFTLGDGKDNNGEAKGFSSSADIVMNDLNTYIGSHPEVSSAINSGRAIFWLGGYSRGGAVTNIVAKRITDQYTGGNEGTSSGNTVFAYCKSAAQGAVEALDKEGGYLNIHNIINKSDIVTYVGPNEMGLKRYGVDHYLPGGEAGEVRSEIKTYGPDDEPLTIYSDNEEYEVNFKSSSYLELRKKFIAQLAAIMPDNEFNDYFSPAEINYAFGNEYTSWIPFIGTDMITEVDYEPLSTKQKFCEEFWARLLKYSANSWNAGHKYQPYLDAKDYREFYANNTNRHFMDGSKYYEKGNVSLQEALCTIIGIAMGGEKELDLSNMMDLTGAATDIALDAYDELIGDLYDCSPDRYTWWIDKVWDLLTSDLSDEQKGKGYQNLKDILGDDIEKADAVYPTLLAMTFDLINDDYIETSRGQYLIGTLAYNANDIINDHLVNIAWIRADDDWYAEDGDKIYDIQIYSSAPYDPAAFLSAEYKDGPETALYEDETAEATAAQVLYLRTQPGGAVYYTMKVDGDETASDVLYQGADGIALPAGATVEVTAYAKAYDQKGGTATYTVNVAPPVDLSKAKIKGIKKQYKYSGKLKKPVPVITLNGTELVPGWDYTVEYSKNKNVGKAKATITGTGKFSGTITKTFKIIPKGTSIRKLKKGRKAITVKWKKQSAKMSKSRITGYQIQVATNKKFTANKKTVTVKGYRKASRTIKDLKAGKKYFVRIRTYKIINSKKYYSAWSKVRKVRTR